MEGRVIEQSRMRAGIARRMVESKQRAPHFYVQAQVGVDDLLGRVDEHNARQPEEKVTVTAGLVAACIPALRAHPSLNSVWTEDGLLQADEVNVGIAIALDDGLLAPALLDAEGLDLPALAAALRDLVERARSQRLRPRELTDASFTLSNLGMFPVSAFTAIITPPQVAILAAARPVEHWLLRDGEPVRERRLTVTLSADHRAVDGVDAARFLETFKSLVETTKESMS